MKFSIHDPEDGDRGSPTSSQGGQMPASKDKKKERKKNEQTRPGKKENKEGGVGRVPKKKKRPCAGLDEYPTLKR